MILLKNRDNTLPLPQTDTVALYGPASYETIAGGTGSGYVNRKYVVSVDVGLKNDGLKIDESLADIYKKYIDYHEKKSKSVVAENA